MSDYSESKKNLGAVGPENAVDSGWTQLVPLVTAQQLRDEFLAGIPLTFQATKQKLQDDTISAKILDAVTQVEEESLLDIFPVQHDERQPFDRNEYMSLGFMRLRHRPVASVESLRVVTSSDQEIWKVALDWLETGYLSKGQLYILPINVAISPSQSTGNPAGGAAFLAILGQLPWVPAYWRVKYTTGFPDGKLPRSVNRLIAIQAAIDVLNLLAAANARVTSQSLGIDGLSQSSSNPGPQIYTTAVAELKEQKKSLIGRLRKRYGTAMFSGNV